MKTYQKILLIIFTLIAIPLIATLFIEKDYEVRKEVSIDLPSDEVYGYLKFLKNQEHFSVWAKMDEHMKKSYTGQDGTVGFISAWESEEENVGAGEQEITAMEDGKRIDYEIRFLKPFKSTSQAFMLTEAISENKTKVTWGFKGRMNYPFNLMLVMMDFKGMIGNDLQTGLNNLKIELEAN